MKSFLKVLNILKETAQVAMNLSGKKIIVIDVGHSSTQRGAYNKRDSVFEWEYNTVLADVIKEIFDNKGLINKIGLKKLSDKYIIKVVGRKEEGLTSLVKTINKMAPDIVVSLHCNAFDTKASGTETLYYFDNKESKKLAEAVQNEMCRILGLRDRGLKKKTEEEKGGYFLKNINCPNIIIEPFFIDNNEDYDIALDKSMYLAEAIVKGILNMMEANRYLETNNQ